MALQPTHIIDAGVLIAYFKGEVGADVFANLIRDDRNILAMHSVNLCEIYYNYLRDDGLETAERAFLQANEIVAIIEKIDQQFLKRVGRWKALYLGGIADSFAAATAEEYGCPLVTTDHNDFDPVEAQALLRIVWLR